MSLRDDWADANAHCKDCCCARCWSALRVTEYTGKDIPTHIRELVAERDALQSRLDAIEAMAREQQERALHLHDWEVLRNWNRLLALILDGEKP